MKKILFILTFLVIPLTVQAQRGELFFRTVSQVVLDSGSGTKTSPGRFSDSSEVVSLSVRDTPHGQVYGKEFALDKNPFGADLRIIVGDPSLQLYTRGWKLRLIPQLAEGATELSYRPVVLMSKKNYEILGRHMVRDIYLEVRSTYADLEPGIKQISGILKLFVENAKAAGILNPDWNEKKQSEQVADASKPEATATVRGKITSIWVGPMENTRGDKVASSKLIMTEIPGGRVRGVWHSGWKFEDGKRVSNVITWELRGVEKGCRSYSNKFVLDPDGKTGTLTYIAQDKCRKPSRYEGSARLIRQ